LAAGLCPGPRWGSLQGSSELAGFRVRGGEFKDGRFMGYGEREKRGIAGMRR